MFDASEFVSSDEFELDGVDLIIDDMEYVESFFDAPIDTTQDFMDDIPY